ncbi:MAG TPA: undecaprenyl-phosphate alpha-N-acetylglucosaminyl 1-phosphate transferase [Vibrio sp.]|uniref:Undecaprenyl-phosphate alpha-N-acetylglucosaminyl 1-phosphate transferase n=2 Tax=Vibrionaceae TaxID=641 RepID=A0A368LFR2_9VIBR|nr:undecaprenyl-phosphate alpha-N-acetylglucosaminyl 1-phosphate transferase [Vibrio casei]HBV77426.1 undecaprenyl-phosphate alpha-N-acetylglucosaminyl 1-phosphate transferase [Vibrio sp.]
MFELFSMFCISFAVTYFLRMLAKRIGLVDRPNERKMHSGAIPLVGGISIYLSFSIFLLMNPQAIPYSDYFLISLTILMIVGALDDKYDVSFKLRFAIQALISLAMMYFTNVKLHTLGDIVGLGVIHLDWFGYVVTVFAVVAAINAFNMVDGIDGLLGGLSVVTFSAIGLLLLADGQTTFSYTSLVIGVIMLPYILMNLGLLGRQRKIFMGDAGSMMIGFMVVWFLLCSSQTKGQPLIRPVTALWLIAIPLMDMAAIMIRRIRRGDSPFKPDREHLHHIFQRLGFSSAQTLMIICFLATLFAGFGILGEMANVPESVMFYIFLVTFCIYTAMLSNVWRITKKLRQWYGLSGQGSQLVEGKKKDSIARM